MVENEKKNEIKVNIILQIFYDTKNVNYLFLLQINHLSKNILNK